MLVGLVDGERAVGDERGQRVGDALQDRLHALFGEQFVEDVGELSVGAVRGRRSYRWRVHGSRRRPGCPVGAGTVSRRGCVCAHRLCRDCERVSAPLQDAVEGCDDGGIELCPGFAPQLGPRVGSWERAPVGPDRDHRVVGVGDADDPR